MVNFNGRWERITDAGINPLPVQRPIPIWIGGYVGGDAVAGWGSSAMAGSPGESRMTRCGPAIDRIRRYAVEAGRDPDRIGLEPQLTLAQTNQDAWLPFVDGWRRLGASHLCVNTMRCGFATPDQHLAAITRVAEALGVTAG